MIDIEKFICSLIENKSSALNDIAIIDICNALSGQGLEYKDGKIVRIEQKPKFKVGDWIICNGITLYIKEVVKGYYRTISKSGLASSYNWDIDSIARLWTIQDAKDGDVLSFDNEYTNYHSIGIFKRIASKNELNGNTYRCYVKYGGFEEKLETPINGDELHHCGTSAHPAIKEQRDTLIKAMADAGYVFDFDKKELKKIEQSPTWNKKDEEMLEDIKFNFEYNKENMTDALVAQYNRFFDKIKFLKPQPKQEWSEEDRDYYDAIIAKLELTRYDALLTDNQMAFLKSLKDRVGCEVNCTTTKDWKPSDLPHWKKSTLPNDNTTGFNSDYFCYKGYNINYKELFKKLPKED